MISRTLANQSKSHFGDFELDLLTGELRKSGHRVRLAEQPFQVLAALLEHPGEMVTRQALMSRLWPGDTFVDFEHGLNAAVKRLRRTLGESAHAPRFVETLPRRGYRFIVSAETAAPPAPQPSRRQAASLGHRLMAWANGGLLRALSLL